MAKSKQKFMPPANGKSFKIVLDTGKAPYKLLWIDVDGNETRRTHHKSVALAYTRAGIWNINYPIVDETK